MYFHDPPIYTHNFEPLESVIIGVYPVIAVGVSVGVPVVTGIYAKPVVALVAGAGDPILLSVVKLNTPAPFVVNT